MEKLDILLISLSLILVFFLGFVINDLYFKDKTDSVNKLTAPINEPPTNNSEIKTTTKSISLGTDIGSCINNTKDNPQCKDCCDCLSGIDGETRTACRDTCAVHDFTLNSNIITITVPSTLGKNGDYSTCTQKADSATCKSCCEESLGLVCGDYQYCRTACNIKFGTTSGPQNLTK